MLCFQMLTKLILFSKSLVIVSAFYTPQSQRLCNLFNINLNTVFATKCLSKYHPLGLLGYSFFICIFIWGYAVRIFERVFLTDYDEVNMYSYYSLETLSTLGYGDYSDNTIGGKIIIIIIAVTGLYL